MSPLLPDASATVEQAIDPSLNYGEVIRDLLAALHIQHIVYVDDCFEKGVDYIREHIAVALQQSEKAAQVEGFFEDIDFNEDSWTDELRKWWEAATTEARQQARLNVQKLDVIPVSADREAAAALAKLLADFPFEYHQVAPEEWEDKAGQWLGAATPDNKLLCLFDKQFAYPSRNGGRLVNGLDMLETAIGDINATAPDYDGRALFGIFSHEFGIEQERAEGMKICRDQSIPRNLFLPLSKARREDMPKLAEGMQMLILNLYAGTMKDIVKDVMRQAGEKVNEALNELDIFAFDDIVLHSSLKEGVWEGETLVRLYLFLQQSNAWDGLANGEVAHKFNEQVRVARKIAKPRLTKTDTRELLFDLRRRELYHASPPLNQLHAPLRLGDVFESTTKYQYILLAPPCDLMVRSGEKDKGQRGSTNELKYVELFRIRSETKEKIEAMSVALRSISGILPHYRPDKWGVVCFKDRIIVPIQVLDLAVLNEEGKCYLDLGHTSVPAPQFHPAWQARHKLLITHFEQYAKLLDALETLLGAQTAGGEEYKTLEATMSAYLNPNGALPGKPSYKARKLDFDFKRVNHYRYTSAQHLLGSYSHFLGRPAEEHDFSAAATLAT